MSTVSKEIADRIIAGEFSEEDIVVIIKYQNIFNGADAYKIVPRNKATVNNIAYLLYGCPSMENAEIYWRSGKKDTY